MSAQPIATAHFTAPYAPLAAALATAEFGTTSASAPAQAGVLIETDDTGLTLRTNDFETVVSITVPEATTTQTGASLLPLAQLRKAMAAMVAGETKATAARTTVTLAGDLLITDHLTVPITAIPVPEFAFAPKPAPVAVTLDTADLRRQLDRVLPAACTDDTLPILTGVQVTLTGRTLTLAATDRYRVAVADVPATPLSGTDDDALSALVPARVMTRVSKHLKGHTGPVGIAYGTHGLTLSVGEATITSHGIEGRLPRHDSLFPTSADSSLALDRATTQRAIKKCRALATAKGGSRLVTLRWDDDGRLTLAPHAGEPEDHARIKGMPIPTTTLAGGPPKAREVHLNPDFLRDALDALTGSDTVTLHLLDQPDRTTPRPLLLTAGPHVTGDDYRHLLMPVRVS
ncbi:hypothetical protein [Streptomyces sp. NPDC088731]|uniref:DNA polymerase III subunit beta family protein n=1 Tax=Streptomyces sp. NPDC088731 TaxID=3365878 RepID=UPI00380F456F